MCIWAIFCHEENVIAQGTLEGVKISQTQTLRM